MSKKHKIEHDTETKEELVSDSDTEQMAEATDTTEESVAIPQTNVAESNEVLSPTQEIPTSQDTNAQSRKQRRKLLRLVSPRFILSCFSQRKIVPMLAYTAVGCLIALLAVPMTRYKLLGTVIGHSYSIVVVDAETNKPVTEATVRVDGKESKTDNKGLAYFASLKVGQKKAEIEKPNYEKTAKTFFVGLKKQTKNPELSIKATGRQVAVLIKDYVTQQPLANAYLTFESFEARSDETGTAYVIVPVGKDTVEISLQKDGFIKKQVSLLVDESATPVEGNTFTLTPSGKIYMLSKQSGKIDVVKTNLDGTEREVVLGGTGFEQDQNTVLIASRDWKHIAVSSVRGKDGKQAIQYIRTSDDKITVADEGDASFSLTGWYGDKLVYIVNRNVENEAEKYKLKSYDTETGKITLLDKTNYKDNGYNCDKYCGEDITNDTITSATLIDGGVVYVYQSYGKNLSIAKVYRIKVNGEEKKELFAISDRYINNLIGWNPGEVYFSYYDYQSQKEHFYEASFTKDLAQEVTDPVEIATAGNGTYNAYLLSPDGKKTFWTESRDGKNVFFTGGKTGDDPKELFREAEYSAYGWFTDNYLLVTKNQSEMYILTVDGTTPVKISDYHKPANGYRPYGYGYGG